MDQAIKATPAQIEDQFAGLIPPQVIRTETVLSKLPIHNLAKNGTISINITQRNENGDVTLQWEVSPHSRFGEPRQLAYKLDTLVVNRRIEEAGKPLPKLIRLGTLREIIDALNLDTGGKTIQRIKNALLQNAFTAITAKFAYTGNDGTAKTLEAAFTRYAVVFTGQKLPNGARADAVYLILNDPYRDVLNNAPFRPLNYDYLRELSPAPQRFYEIVSYRMFAALKHQRTEAKLSYSEYCTCSAQQRYYDYDRFKKQMYKIHRPHLASGYLKSVRYQATRDGEGKPDWEMFYEPGPKARAEHLTFTKSGRVIDLLPEMETPSIAIAPSHQPKPPRTTPQKPPSLALGAPSAADPDLEDPPALAELRKRGIGQKKAREIAAVHPPELIIDTLEWGDHLIRQRPKDNPPGFYVHLFLEKMWPPETFETSRRRKAREAARAARDHAAMLAFEREEAYHAFRKSAIDQHIAQSIRPDDFAGRIRAQMAHDQSRPLYRNLPESTRREMAERNVRAAIADELDLPTLEQFSKREGQGNAVASDEPPSNLPLFS
jgi:Replication initiator protein A